MFDLTTAVVIYCVLVAAVFVVMWLWYDRRDHRRFELERRKTTFHCIRCDKPFGTLQMVENMLGRLGAHPAFAGHLDRLRMCGDCRVIDMMEPRDEMRVTTLKRT